MLDLDFIDQPPRLLNGVVVYKCRTGVLRQRFIRSVEAIALRCGTNLNSWTPDELISMWSSPGLFDGMRICDLSRIDGRSAAISANRLLALTAVPPPVPTVILVRDRDWQTKISHGQSLLLVTEPLVNRTNLSLVLGYFSRHHDLPIRIESPTVRSYFADVLEGEGGEMDLRSFLTSYDQAALLYADPIDGSFSMPSYKDGVREGRSYIVGAVTKLVHTPCMESQVNLLRALSIKAGRGWSEKELADESCRAATVLLERSADLNKILVGRAALWACLTLFFTEDVRADGSGLAALSEHFLLRAHEQLSVFRKLTAGSIDDDSFNWRNCGRAIRKILERTVEGKAEGHRFRLASQLHISLTPGPNELIPSWGVAVLSEICHLSLDRRPFEKDFDCAGLFAANRRDDQIYGHLKKMLTSEKPIRPLVIVGPPGVGKRASAQFYAKAKLCDDRIETEPCEVCDSCVGFDPKSSFGYIEVDLSHPAACQHVLQLVATLNDPSLADHRTIVFTNADAATVAVDALLKPFEDGVKGATFFILASDDKKLRSAILSRSEIVRVKPLGQKAASALVTERLAGLQCDRRVISLIVLSGEGRPDDLSRACEAVLTSGAVTVYQAKRALNVDWGAAVLDVCYRMFAGEEHRGQVALLIQDTELQQLESRVRRVLWCLSREDTLQEPALFDLHSAFEAACEAIGKRCDPSQVIAMWTDLFALWLGNDVANEDGMWSLLWKASAVVSRYSRRESGPSVNVP